MRDLEVHGREVVLDVLSRRGLCSVFAAALAAYVVGWLVRRPLLPRRPRPGRPVTAPACPSLQQQPHAPLRVSRLAWPRPQ